MQIPLSKRSSTNASWGLVVLVIGILIGALLRPFEGAVEEEDPGDLARELVLEYPVAPATVAQEPPENDLRTIHVDLDDAASQRLQEVYDRSMEARRIVQEEGDLVPATIRADGKTIQARVRIKGDFLDHLDTDKWSLRIELKSDKLWGMSRFSIQHPKTRSYLWEWLFMEMARRDGLLAPRADFVNVVMNGNATGIYYLEEHFTKELLESQGRREGPIVRFVEDTRMDAEANYFDAFGYASTTVEPAIRLSSARIAAYGEKRLTSSEALSRQLQQALEHMRGLQQDEAGHRTHELLDVRSNAVYGALSALFRTSHGLNWKSVRYYHNPVTARLEPVIFDTQAGYPRETRDPIEVLRFVIPAYLKNGPFYDALFEEIGRISSPDYIDACFADLMPRLRHFEELLRAEGLDDPLLDAAAVEAALRLQQVHLHELVHPRMPVSFDAHLITDDEAAERPKGLVELEAWGTTGVPVVVDGFRLENGVFLDAASLEVDGPARPLAGRPGALVLPTDGTHVTFRFRNDEEREAVLRDVAQIRDALTSGDSVDRSLKLNVTAYSRLITDEESEAHPVPIRKFGPTWSDEGGRPEPPSVDEALEKHSFLRRGAAPGHLVLTAGEHDVDGDLVVPSGHVLHAGPGTRLAFGPGRALITDGPLFFEGTEEAPIRLQPLAGATSWGGVAVLQPASEKSVWRHVQVRDTDIIQRGGWMMTGGITFFRAPVELYSCRFDNALGEDALNIFAAEFLLDGVEIDTVASDAFDGDFVSGLVVRSSVANSVEDAVDVSGSEITVRDCRFVDVGDKAVSAGENSRVDVRDCVVESASIAIASKDSSHVDVDGLQVWSTINYGFAAYIKKAEFGPCTIVARNVELGDMGRGDYLIQTGCSLELNGRDAEVVPVDVKEMYRRKILGQ